MSSEKLDSMAGGKKRDPDFINNEESLLADLRAPIQSPPPSHRARQRAGRKAKDGPGTLAMRDYANMFESIRGLASGIHAINQRAVKEYTPVVEAILRSPIPDTRHIECTLDGLLDFCGYEPALHLYKKLCRYYFYINPTATVEYIEAYRELWDSDQEAKT
jgi:hypothetical protein